MCVLFAILASQIDGRGGVACLFILFYFESVCYPVIFSLATGTSPFTCSGYSAARSLILLTWHDLRLFSEPGIIPETWFCFDCHGCIWWSVSLSSFSRDFSWSFTLYFWTLLCSAYPSKFISRAVCSFPDMSLMQITILTRCPRRSSRQKVHAAELCRPHDGVCCSGYVWIRGKFTSQFFPFLRCLNNTDRTSVCNKDVDPSKHKDRFPRPQPIWRDHRTETWCAWGWHHWSPTSTKG